MQSWKHFVPENRLTKYMFWTDVRTAGQTIIREARKHDTI